MDLYHYKVEEYRVIDGDSMEVLAALGFDIYKRVSVRLEGINTPERRGREAPAGRAVTLVVRNYLDSHRPQDLIVESREWGKYAGRCLGEIHCDGQALGAFLRSAGFAKDYALADGSRTTFDDQELEEIRQLCHDELIHQFEQWVEPQVGGYALLRRSNDQIMSDFGQEFGYLDEEGNPTELARGLFR